MTTNRMSGYKARVIGYIVRSETNPALVYCTDGEFHADMFVGPGCDLGAKLYKTRRNAEKVRGGYKIIVEGQVA